MAGLMLVAAAGQRQCYYWSLLARGFMTWCSENSYFAGLLSHTYNLALPVLMGQMNI
jgi:hypothetical protein